MANPWLSKKRRNWRDNPSMMDLYRQAMMDKYSSIQYPYGTGFVESATEEPAFIPRGRTPKPKEEVKEEIKTVITETDDDTPTKKVTTITGGIMGDVPTGQDDPQDERGMGMWDDDMAQLRARQQQGTAAPTQQAVEGALERYARMRRSQLAPPSRDSEQIAQVDPRIVALNQPPVPEGIPLGYGQDDDAGQPRVSSDAAVQGMIQDAMRHGRSKQRAESGYPAREEFSEFATPDKGMLHYLLNPFESFPATEEGDHSRSDVMIRDQREREEAADKREKETGRRAPTLAEQLGFTKEHFRWKGKDDEVVEESEIVESEEVDPSLPGNLQKVGKSSTGWPGPGLDNPPYELPKEEDDQQAKVDVARADANPGLWQAWGDYVRKPGERKAAYMKNLSDIFRKAMIMNAVAQLTGGTSQASAYVKFATAKLDAIEKFDQEDRLQGAWKSIMFNEDGTFNPPSGYGEALERAAKLGVSPKEAKAFSALFPKAATSKFWVYDNKAKKNVRITDEQYTKDDGRYTAVSDAGGRATQAAIVDIPFYFDDAGLDEAEKADVMQILQKPNAIMELWKKYPELMRLYKKKEDETSAAGFYGLNALTAAAGRQQEGTQPRTPGIKIESVEDVQ